MMAPKKLTNKSEAVRPQLQTVQDVEVKHCGNPTPTSPPATEEDRMNFQKLLLQMNEKNPSVKSNNLKLNDSAFVKNSAHQNKNPLHQKKDQNHLENRDPNFQTNAGSLLPESNLNNVQTTPQNAKVQGERRKRVRSKKSQKLLSESPCPSTDSYQANTGVVDCKEGSLKLDEQTAKVSSSGESPAAKHSNDSQKNLKSIKKKENQEADFVNSPTAQSSGTSKPEPMKGKKLSEKPAVFEKVVERPLKSEEMSPTHSQSESKFRREFDDRKAPEVIPARGGQHINGPNHQQPMNIETKQPIFVHDLDPGTLLVACLNRIVPKDKDPTSFHCLPCDKVFVDLKRHFEKQRESHTFKWKIEVRRYTVKFLPELAPKHFSLLDDMVESITKEYGMTCKKFEEASDAWQRLQTLASTGFPGCSVRWFGSHFSNIALRDNEVLNMDLYVPCKEDAASTFLKFISVVERDSSFGNIDRVIATNFAHANMMDKKSSFLIQLSLNNTGAYHTAKLIREYVTLHPCVRPLCIFFRAWGKLCGLDRGEDGSWQGHAFPIMVIHFLQQKRVLPVLHDFVDTPEKNPEIYASAKDLHGKWTCQIEASLGRLLFDMLKFYSIEHDVENHIVCITQFKPFLRSDTKWSAKRIAVMDPFQPKHNISRFITANMYGYVHYCLLATVCALGVPRTATGPLYGFIVPPLETHMFQRCSSLLDEYYKVLDVICELVLREDESFDTHIMRKNNKEIVPQLNGYLQNSFVFGILLNRVKTIPEPPQSLVTAKSPSNKYRNWGITPNQASLVQKYLRKDLLKYSFDKSLFTDNEEPPISCTSCHRHGHVKAECPDEVIPKLKPLPTPSKELIRVLNQLCQHVFDDWSPGPSEQKLRSEICEDLLSWLQNFYPDIELHLFGSSCNGFGGKSSDIDMCLTYKNNDSGVGLNFPALVEEITHKLRGHKNVFRLLPITTAKVPIVKFEYGRNHIQVDMSLYNLLGIMNTKLLLTYSTIDPRVRPLVYMMKRLAKTTGIGDASRGSLSSYAYSLMTLYFLQQVNPPVIPVLQELADPGTKPGIELIEFANVYFFKNVEKLNEVWPHINENKSTLGELWLQLLEFYASDSFHRTQKVVCIRKKEPLYKFDKLWTSTNLCIEDPFDLNHNLGSGLTKRMNIFIVKTFQKALKHFSYLPKPEIEMLKGNLEVYFFHEGSLTVGKPPSDRGCHFCHVIGHVQYDCPKRIANHGRVGGKRATDSMRGNLVSKQTGNARSNFNFDNFSRRSNQRVVNHAIPPRPGHAPAPRHPLNNHMTMNQVASNLIPQKLSSANTASANKIPPNHMHTKIVHSNHLPTSHLPPNQISPNPLQAQTHPLMLPVRPPPGFPIVAPGPPGRPMMRVLGAPMMPGIPLQGPPLPTPHTWR